METTIWGLGLRFVCLSSSVFTHTQDYAHCQSRAPLLASSSRGSSSSSSNRFGRRGDRSSGSNNDILLIIIAIITGLLSISHYCTVGRLPR